MSHITLAHFLAEHTRKHEDIEPPLNLLLNNIGETCRQISSIVKKGALGGALGSLEQKNVQGETQKKMDVIANDTLLESGQWSGLLAAMASEEMEHHYPIPEQYPKGDYLMLFDPLDGSSNIDINVSVGTIFSILKAPQDKNADIQDQDFLQNGRQQLAAGYALYGPQSMLILTLGHGVYGFTLSPSNGSWILTHENLQIPEQTQEFAINMSNYRHWDDAVSHYIKDCLDGEEGPREKNFNMRWIASMVTDVHRILMRGGVFIYPWDKRDPKKAGKLRLMYEANPMSFLIEQAGGASFNGEQDVLDISPNDLHQRVSVMLGSKQEIDIIKRYHQESKKA